MNEEIEELLHRENLTLASTQARSMAFFIDELLLSFMLIIALWEPFSNATNIEEVIHLTTMFVLEYIAMKFIYQAFFVMNYGASILKIVMKIRVIDMETLDNPNVINSLVRSLVRIFSESFFYLGFLWGMLNPNKQTWHDLASKTLVINV